LEVWLIYYEFFMLKYIYEINKGFLKKEKYTG